MLPFDIFKPGRHRAMTGEAIAFGAEDQVAAQAARDRRRGGPTAPAEGLYLMAVRYGNAGA